MAKKGITLELKGTREVVQRLNYKAQELKGVQGERALIRSAALIRRDMDMTAPKIPVDTGNLRGSWTVVPIKGISGRRGIIMGFTANYAAVVHFALEKQFKRPDSGPLFFSTALKRNEANILKIFAEEMKI